jgi:hypothetical protein
MADHNSTSHDAHVSTVTPADDVRTIMLNRVSWSAVFAGVAVALVTQLLLNMLGVGIGLATLDPATGDNPAASTFSIGAGLWFAIAGILASLIGGYVAGRLCGKPKDSTASWHGLTTWAVTTLVIFYLLTSALGGVIGGTYRTVADAFGGVASAAGTTAQTAAMAAAPNLGNMDPMASIENSVRSASGGQDPETLRDTAVAAVRAVVTGDEAQAQQARERAAQAIATAQNIPVEQARTQVEQYERQYRETMESAKQQATEAADITAKAGSTAALLAAVSLIIGAIASWFGGRMGAVNPTVTGYAGAGTVSGRRL